MFIHFYSYRNKFILILILNKLKTLIKKYYNEE